MVVARCFINFNVESRIILVKTYASSERISIDYTTDCCQSKLFSGWLAGRKQNFYFLALLVWSGSNIWVKTYASSERISIDYRPALLPAAKASFFLAGWLVENKTFIFWPCWSGRGQTFEDIFLKYIQWMRVRAVAGFNNSISCSFFSLYCFVSRHHINLLRLFLRRFWKDVDVGQGINIGPGKFGKKNKCRALNTHVLCSK